MPTGPKKVPRPPKSYHAPPKGGHYDRRHRELRRLLLERRPFCVYQYPGCTGWATDANHLVYPATRVEDYAPCCSTCHAKWHRDN